MKDKINWKYALIALACFIALVFIIDFVLHKTLHNRPELQIAESFLKQNQNTKSIFGEDIILEYLEEGSRVTYIEDKVLGNYQFKIIGNKKKGQVNVYWETGENKSCNILKIASSEPWKQETTIWQKINI